MVQGTLENAIEFLIILKISVHLRPKLLRVEAENWSYLFELVVGYRLLKRLNIGYPMTVKQNLIHVLGAPRMADFFKGVSVYCKNCKVFEIVGFYFPFLH